MTVRTRFAPSPTGLLHIGGARTALFCWLYARNYGGQFVLRIEDTDRARSTSESVQAIFDSMEWLGLDYDEGPFYQTRRFDRYREVLDQLLEQGDAYRCYCTREELDEMRAKQLSRKENPRYDGRCRTRQDTPSDVAPVVRFRSPDSGSTIVEDLVRGSVQFANSELDDLIIARSDGTPTYNFTVVVDDWDMQISHVIRGDDHLNNTPRQVNILRALGADLPVYAHVPMIFGPDGSRLSKRHGAVSVLEYRDQGYLPEALLNYLVRLGWSHGDQELFSLSELVELFSLEAVNKSASVFNPEKLIWLNQMHIKGLASETLGHQLGEQLSARGIPVQAGPLPADVADSLRDRSKTLVDMADRAEFFYRAPEQYDPKAGRKFLTEEGAGTLRAVRDALAGVEVWAAESVHGCLHELAEAKGLKFGKIAQPIRTAVAGVAVSPPMDVTLELLGREVTLQRLDSAIEWIAANASN